MFPKSLAVFPLPRNDLQSVINHKQAGQSQSRVEGGWRAHRPPRPIAPQQVARAKGPARPGPSGRTVFHPRYLGGRRHGDSGVTARVVTLVSHSCHTRVILVSHSCHTRVTARAQRAVRQPFHTHACPPIPLPCWSQRAGIGHGAQATGSPACTPIFDRMTMLLRHAASPPGAVW